MGFLKDLGRIFNNGLDGYVDIKITERQLPHLERWALKKQRWTELKMGMLEKEVGSLLGLPMRIEIQREDGDDSWDKVWVYCWEYPGGGAVYFKKKILVGFRYYGDGLHVEKGRPFQKVSPTDAKAYYNRGGAYLKKDEYDRAISEFTKAIEMNPWYAEAYKGRGSAYLSEEMYYLAIPEFTKALEVNPKDAEAYKDRGIAYLWEDEYYLAIADCTKAIELNPKDAETYYFRGVAHAFVGLGKAISFKSVCKAGKEDYDLAIADYTKTLEIDPWRGAYVYYNRARVYCDRGEYDKAWEDVHKAQSLGHQVDPEFLKRLREASEKTKN